MLSAGLAFGVSQGVMAEHHHGEHHMRNPRDIDAMLKVKNETDFDMYITVNGRNLGRVSRNSSEEYHVKCGSQYVEAEIGESHVGKDIEIHPHTPRGEVTFSPSNFSRLPEINVSGR